MRRNSWNTYAVRGYMYQVGTDDRATGGVHRHEVRRYRDRWQKRIVDANGSASSPGEVDVISDEDGEALYSRACSYFGE